MNISLDYHVLRLKFDLLSLFAITIEKSAIIIQRTYCYFKELLINLIFIWEDFSDGLVVKKRYLLVISVQNELKEKVL